MIKLQINTTPSPNAPIADNSNDSDQDTSSTDSNFPYL